MPSSMHATLVELLEAHPEALAYLLELAGHPPRGPLILTTGTRCKPLSIERRVDRAYLVGSREKPAGFVLAEIQLGADEEKRLSWPLYVELARTRHRCEGALVVITASERVRRWIRRRIMSRTGWCGSWRQLKPKILAIDKIDPALLLRPDRPYLAQLAVAARASMADAQEVAETAVDITTRQLPKRLALEQLDAILGMVDEALRAHLERRIMEHPQYRSPLFRSLYRRGKVKGKAEGKAEGQALSILAVLEARGLPVSATIRERVLGCADVATLDMWIRRAAVAPTAAAVVRRGGTAQIETRAPARRSRKT